MKYTKPAISFQEQINRLKARGLSIEDNERALNYLSNISYYRLRAYTYPFQDNDVPNHPFIQKISLEEIVQLYVFDRRLRHLVFKAINIIEISFRTQIIYHWSLNHGSFWHTQANLFRDSGHFEKQYTRLQKEIKRSQETFIKHYLTKYGEPKDPPAWMSLEVSSLGLLSLIFKSLKFGVEKRKVGKHYGLHKVEVLENWMHAFSDVRNICAHHSRLWNRRLTTHIKFPTKTNLPFIKNQNILPYKIYAVLSCMVYILKVIGVENNFKNNIKELIYTCPLAQVKEMGFPDDWQEEALWK